MINNVTDSIIYVGVDDRDIDLFEGQYIVPEGISYNSYGKYTKCVLAEGIVDDDNSSFGCVVDDGSA